MFLLITGIGGAGPQSGGAGLQPGGGDSAAAGTLAALCDEYWEGRLAANPIEATGIGDRRYDDRLDDNSLEGYATSRSRLTGVRERARAIPEVELGAADRLTLSALLTEVESDLAKLDCALHEWTVDPLGGPQIEFFNLESFQTVRGFAEAQAMVKRWQAMGPYLGRHVANLERGLAAGKVAPVDAVRKVIGGLRETLTEPDAQWALLLPLATPHPDWSDAQRAGFANGLTAAVRDSVRPALARYLAFLEAQIAPAARPETRAGVMHVAGGDAIYRQLIRVHTSLDLTPDELHATGLAEVERINGEMSELGRKVLGTAGLAETLARLRTDPALYFTTRDEVAGKAEAALARAKGAIGSWFGLLPKADCAVVRMGEHEEKISTIAYYRDPAADGSRPGQFYINTYAPETRPRYEAEALAYHESIPGHHLQLAIAQELRDMPRFRKHVGVTAYIEGWGLYSERLADEMGLYSSDLDRIGMLSLDAWRACRLVVDTGLHAKGWSRQRAIDFMRENSAIALNNIVNEVDRYIVWPGQALAYKTGQLEILRLRDEAKRTLGARFDIQRFHDVVLSNGALALVPLRQVVAEYAAGARGGREDERGT
jgi:uncharacterized protein (DUF885 family)